MVQIAQLKLTNHYINKGMLKVAKINDQIKQMFENLNEPPSIATVDDEGKPNVACKGTLGVLDDENLWYAEVMGFKTYQNLKQNPAVAVVITNRENFSGYQFKGTAEILKEGPLYEKAVQIVEIIAARTGVPLPPPKAAIKIKVDEIYTLGPTH